MRTLFFAFQCPAFTWNHWLCRFLTICQCSSGILTLGRAELQVVQLGCSSTHRAFLGASFWFFSHNVAKHHLPPLPLAIRRRAILRSFGRVDLPRPAVQRISAPCGRMHQGASAICRGTRLAGAQDWTYLHYQQFQYIIIIIIYNSARKEYVRHIQFCNSAGERYRIAQIDYTYSCIILPHFKVYFVKCVPFGILWIYDMACCGLYGYENSWCGARLACSANHCDQGAGGWIPRFSYGSIKKKRNWESQTQRLIKKWLNKWIVPLAVPV